MTAKRKRPVTRPGAGYSQALSELYSDNGRYFPRRGRDCKGLQPVSYFLVLALDRIDSQAAKRTAQRLAA